MISPTTIILSLAREASLLISWCQFSCCLSISLVPFSPFRCSFSPIFQFIYSDFHISMLIILEAGSAEPALSNLLCSECNPSPSSSRQLSESSLPLPQKISCFLFSFLRQTKPRQSFPSPSLRPRSPRASSTLPTTPNASSSTFPARNTPSNSTRTRHASPLFTRPLPPSFLRLPSPSPSPPLPSPTSSCPARDRRHCSAYLLDVRRQGR